MLAANGGNIDDVLLYLRENALSKMDSMKVLMSVTGMSRNQAKAIVHGSSAWSEVAKRDERFHESLVRDVGLTANAGEGSGER